MTKRTALVIGATGLVGSRLLELLLDDERFSTIRVFGRRNTGIRHPKLEEHVIDFDQPAKWAHLVKGDVAFSALGTTLKAAGSKKAQFKVDHDYQYYFASAAAENDVAVFVLVSAATASERSLFFYSRMKGILEKAVRQLPFTRIHILQPGLLKGKRSESRTGEKIAISVVEFLNRIGIAKKQRPVDATILAQAMINVSFRTASKPVNIYTLLEVFEAAR